jgi:hypothetical protein
MTPILFNICNLTILLVWSLILFLPKWKISEQLISYPWVPLGISFFYTYFIIVSGGLAEADFSSLDGIVTLFKNTTPESAAAGWLHYLAFDFWVGCWIIRHSRKNNIVHLAIIFPLLCTFMLGPIGVMMYSFLLFGIRQFRKAK